MAAFARSKWNLFSVALIAAMIAPSFVNAQPMGGGAPTTAPAAARPQPAMEAINTAFRALGRQINDASKNESSLALLADLQRNSIVAKSGIPPVVASAPEADRAAKLTAYKKEMVKLIRQELDTEEALLAGDNAKAADLVKAMNATQMEGHAEFRPRRGGGGRPGGAPAGGAAPSGDGGGRAGQ